MPTSVIRIYTDVFRYPMARLIILGTGGGRHTAMFQARSTGGFILDTGKCRIHMDPGPGALTGMRTIGYDLRSTDAVLVSHCHPDHYSDAEVAVEGMTYGGWRKRGMLCGSVSVMEGYEGLGPCISPYHQSLPEECRTLRPGDELEFPGVKIKITKSDHGDPTTVGFRCETEDGILSYVTDTAYSDEMAKQYIGSKVVLLPITTPDGNRIRGHMCTEDAKTFLEVVKPELAVFIHLGIVILKVGADLQAASVAEATGVKTLSGEDLTELDLNNLEIKHIEPMKSEWNDAWNL